LFLRQNMAAGSRQLQVMRTVAGYGTDTTDTGATLANTGPPASDEASMRMI
jgi:hypothetical protein